MRRSEALGLPRWIFALAGLAAASLAFTGCATTSPTRPLREAPGAASSARPAPAGVDPGSEASLENRGPSPQSSARGREEADNLEGKARAALEAGHLSEAILSYLGVIALFRESGDSALRSPAESAAAELARIGARLSIEPGSEWLGQTGAQLPGEGRGIGKEGARSPSVYLYENFGSGKSPVADAPIYFEFMENSGSLIPLVTTDAYGRANTTLSALESPGKAALIRAYPLFRVRDTRYAFRSVFREFAYLPPPRSARLLLLERGAPATVGPRVDALLAALKPLGLELSPLDPGRGAAPPGTAPGAEFEALSRLGSAGYLALAQIEASAPRQMELGGRKYNIFTSEASAAFRLLRADGGVVFALPLGGFKGQGGTGEAAAADAADRAGEALLAAIAERIDAIKAALEAD